MEENKDQKTQPLELEEADEVKEIKEKLALCERERDEYLNGWRRAKADLTNYKNEELARTEATIKFGNDGLLKDLIAVMDSFDLALAAQAGGHEGLSLIRSQLEAILKRNGLTPIIVGAGDKFDPSIHEAIAEEEADQPSGTVLALIEKGWKLHEKVLRPSRVKLAK